MSTDLYGRLSNLTLSKRALHLGRKDSRSNFMDNPFRYAENLYADLPAFDIEICAFVCESLGNNYVGNKSSERAFAKIDFA